MDVELYQMIFLTIELIMWFYCFFSVFVWFWYQGLIGPIETWECFHTLQLFGIV